MTTILAQEFRLPEGIPAMRQTLAARTAEFAERVNEPDLRGFIALAMNDSLPDDDWLDPIAVRIIRAGLASWTDSHLKQFRGIGTQASGSTRSSSRTSSSRATAPETQLTARSSS